MTPMPHETVMQMSAAWLLSRSLHVVTDLGVADVLDETPQTAAALAQATGAHVQALERTLRLLSAYGVFATCDGMFAHTPSSRLLRTDHPQSLRPLVRMFGLSFNHAAYCFLEHSLRTGRPAVEQVAPAGMFTYLADHPEEARVFGAAMTAKAHGHVACILDSYDFSSFDVIGDIGGGHGHLLRAVLERAQTATGVLFELPNVIGEVADLASDRLTLRAGDFFKDPLPTCDAYLLMEVIHDWGDAEATTILKAVRAAAPVHAKLLVIEQIVPDEPGPHWSKTLDVLMLAVTGGLQRTAQEYEALLASSGFRLERLIDTSGGISIVEAVPT
jgi:O-methyltransferase domain